MNKIKITEAGLKALLAEQKEIIEVKIPNNVLAIGHARAQGDLSENAEYASAKEVQGELNHRLKEINEILKYASVVTATGSEIVSLGNTVSLVYVDLNKEFTMQLVSTYETNPLENKFSDVSPLGEAILNKKVNDIVTVSNKKVRILSIS